MITGIFRAFLISSDMLIASLKFMLFAEIPIMSGDSSIISVTFCFNTIFTQVFFLR